MQPSLILFIDDNQTVRKVVEGYLSQEGHRVLLAADAERGLELARTSRPDLILLDHQLPGTTGDQIVRRLIESEETAEIPVVICSAMRNKAFVSYADFPNVVDQIPKPFTAEMLKSGVSNALQTGSLVVRAQRTGSAMPESIDNQYEPVLQGSTAVFPIRTLFDFLNNGRHEGRLILEAGRDRLHFALSGGRIQAVYSPTISPAQLADQLPDDLADLAPLLAVTLAERQDSQVSGLIGLLEKVLTDPRRPRALLRFQAGVLTHRALTEDPGPFVFLPSSVLPPVFRAFPLQMSLPALAVEGVRRCDPIRDASSWTSAVYRRPTLVGANPDGAGLSAVTSKIHAALDGMRDLETLSREFELGLEDVVNMVRGLELIGLVERRSDDAQVLVLEEDPTAIEVIKQALQEKSLHCQFKIVQERVAAQLLMKRGRFDIVMLALDQPDQEQFYSAMRTQSPATTRFVGLTKFIEEAELVRLDSIGLDGIIERPITVEAVKETVKLLVGSRSLERVS
jgi:CheY-like chemotaxis protein